jgi:tetratricopeptide (TPR) repeat protein
MNGEKPGFLDKEFKYAIQTALNQPKDKLKIVPVRLEDCQRGDHIIDMFNQCDLFPDLKNSLDQLAVQLGGCSLSDAKAKDERTEEEKLIESIMGRGAIFIFSREYDKSIPFWEAVININQKYYPAWYNKGMALFCLFRPDEALDAFYKVIEIEPKHHTAWYNIGNLLDKLDRKKEAEEAFKKSNEILTEIEKKLLGR